jgi:hypothetical protein
VTDTCIPENTANVTVVTQDIDRVTLTGPSRGAVGSPLSFVRGVLSTTGKPFSAKTLSMMAFSHSPLSLINSGDNYQWTPSEIGNQVLSVTVDGHTAEHSVNVFPVPKFAENYTVFRNRSVPFKILGGPGDLTEYHYSFAAPSIASVDPSSGLIHGLEKGATTLTATIENAPPATAIVRVIEIYGILFERSTDTPYVGSYVLFSAWLNNSGGREIFARNVTWSVLNAANWTVDGETLVIYGDKPGEITITAQCLWFSRSLTFTIDYELVVKQSHILLAIGASTKIDVERNLPVLLSTPESGLRFGPGNVITAVSPGAYAVSVFYKTQLRTVAIVASEPDTFYIENRTSQKHILDPDGQEYDDADAAAKAKEERASWHHRFVPDEPNDSETRGLFGYQEFGTDNPWGVSEPAIRINPGETGSIELDPRLGDIASEFASADLHVSINEGQKTQLIVVADKNFKAPGRIILVHIPTGKRLEIAVLAPDGATKKIFVALASLVGSGGYIVSKLI